MAKLYTVHEIAEQSANRILSEASRLREVTVKTAGGRRQEMHRVLKEVSADFARYGQADRVKIEFDLGKQLGLKRPEEMSIILKEASLKELGSLLSDWDKFFFAVGI